MNALAANLKDACDRYETHRALKARSAPFYAKLKRSDKAFIDDWISAEVHAIQGKYADLSPKALAGLLLKRWSKIFVHAPTLKHDAVMYRAIGGDHAKAIAALKSGQTIALDRYSSFAHSPDMVRKYAAMLIEPGSDTFVCIVCVRVPMGTKFAFLSGTQRRGGLNGIDRAAGLDDIDKSQGEVILAPLTLRRRGRSRTIRMCEGVLDERYDRTMDITIVEMDVTPA